MAGVTWYAFDFKDYASDTARLSCEAHGAYIQLIADYYNSGEGPPDDDFVLAAITKLPVDQWQKHRKVIERFFEIRDGRWHHARIETEIRSASEKHAASIAAAKVGATARWEKERAKSGQSTAPTHQDTAKPRKNANRNAVRMPDAEQPQSERSADLHLHPLIEGGGEAPPAPEAPDEDFQVGPVPKDFTPDPATSDRAYAAGMTVAEIDAEVRKFILKRQGQLGDDWQGSFALWIERQIEYRAKEAAKAAAKAPPRIEVNNARYEPTAAELDRALALFASGGPWSHKTFGPEPGQLGCRIPAVTIEKHGIDPKTGMKRRAAS